MDPSSLSDTISTVMGASLWIGLIVGAMICGTIGAVLADHKGERDLIMWYIICAVLGIIGLSIVACLPNARTTHKDLPA